ncbi:MAG TPA: bifunctional fucokinase/fucose-1-phosphate guanylyltransferase [Verrucomicrobiota bacterium]|nr:bifunctional fucokinase/fucose-1-phosphate guanylyltransferase [Verrucomicrobiota bacterium]HNU53008.1 bifunctional fucokinase/fucose-1-phosphate guanylyltransferase [Verrucomicrobiota bacterium]
MTPVDVSIECFVSLPPRAAAAVCAEGVGCELIAFAACDPPGRPLGSGGGAAHLLVEAWKARGGGCGFREWLRSSRKLLVHGGGESRRLPAYAAMGKPLMPIPALRWARGQRLDQTLLDLQLPGYRRILAHAPGSTVAMIASGDVLLRFGRELPRFPAVDVLGLGMWVTPERAKEFGVFFTPRNEPSEIAFFLQKPAPGRTRELGAEHVYLIDTGMWLLSERALGVLMARSGWEAGAEHYLEGEPGAYDLYGGFALALGRQPTRSDPEIRALTCAVVPLPEAEFHHFGTSRQMIESVSALQNLELDETKLGLMGARRHPDQYLQNARFRFPLRHEENHTLWVENSDIPSTWRLACDHVLTGVPDNGWDLVLEAGVCLDFVPVGEEDWCLRFYGMDDTFRGAVGDPGTIWLGRPFRDWLTARGVGFGEAGIDPGCDLYDAPVFPVLASDGLDPRYIEWLFNRVPPAVGGFGAGWRAGGRLSARAIPQKLNWERLERQRSGNRVRCLGPMLANAPWSVFLKLDLESTARLYAASDLELAPASAGRALDPLQEVHREVFCGAVLRHRGVSGADAHEEAAFRKLREVILRDAQLNRAEPRCMVQEDQIVWGRCPVRLDLAGGWTDTPPYCLEHGGRVVNMAVNLNGQPPIQVFAKLSSRPELIMRSIDLGAEQRVRTYEELDTFDQPGSEFAVAKAALALAGFLPRFHARGGYPTLEAQLAAFGGGIEVSVLSAVPKGSGLGTSSILAATLLGTVGNLCGLDWDRNVLFSRTLALEQMLTTGGGWQDQAGGLFRGIKLIETRPGLSQQPTLRWVPDHLFGADRANRTTLLYYTGLTRLAKSILHEIVRRIFLNATGTLDIIADIGVNAEAAFGALQRSDAAGLEESIRVSWHLNQRLDSGTNPPAVQAILDEIGDWLVAAKLLGAGGGGFLLLFARDEAAGRRIRETLVRRPPNPRARFVEFSLSETGLQITRS